MTKGPIKPCPCCGGEARLLPVEEFGIIVRQMIECQTPGCWLTMEDYADNTELVVANWNRRVVA